MDRTEIKLGDILSFSYHGHFWKVYDESERSFTYQLLGAASKGYKETKNGKRYYDSKTSLKKGAEDGKVKIHELREVDEVIEKTVLKKVPYLPIKKQEKDTNETIAINGEVTEQTQEPVKTKTNADFEIKFNEEKNGIELYFNGKPSEEIRAKLKENGFRWSKYGKFWYAKDTEERRDFIKSLQGVDEVTGGQKESEESNNVIDLEKIKNERESQNVAEQKEEQKENIEEVESVSFDFDDVLNKFDNIDMSVNNRISAEDQKEISEYEKIYNETKQIILNTIEYIESNYIKKRQYNTYETSTNTNGVIERYKLYLMREAQNYKNAIIKYFENTYGVDLDEITEHNFVYPEKDNFFWVKDRYDKYLNIDSTQIIDLICDTLGGLTFAEKQDVETKEKAKNLFNKYDNKKIKITKNKISIPDVYIISYDSIWSRYEIPYNSEKDLFVFINALNYFEFGNTENKGELKEMFLNELGTCAKQQFEQEFLFQKHELKTFNKVTGLKFYKNRKLEIEFKTPELARQFAKEYLGLAVNVA